MLMRTATVQRDRSAAIAVWLAKTRKVLPRARALAGIQVARLPILLLSCECVKQSVPNAGRQQPELGKVPCLLWLNLVVLDLE